MHTHLDKRERASKIEIESEERESFREGERERERMRERERDYAIYPSCTWMYICMYVHSIYVHMHVCT